MAGANDKTRFLREGLFAKYVVSLVGLVVFVLAVNGAMESWISYRATKTQLTDGLEDKAQAAARRIEQSISELERQISWVTRASQDTLEKRRADYAQLLHQVSVVTQLFQLNGDGREVLRVSRQSTTTGSNADLSRDMRFTDTVARGVSYAPAWFSDRTPFMSISVAHSGFNAGVTVAELDLSFLSEYLSDAQVGKAAFAYVVDPRGRVLATSSKGPDVGKDLSKLPQVAAAVAPGHAPDNSGTDFNGHAVMSAASTAPKLAAGRGGVSARPRAHGPEAGVGGVVGAADHAGPDADPRPAGAHCAADGNGPAGRDPRRHASGAPHDHPDHGAARRRAQARRG